MISRKIQEGGDMSEELKRCPKCNSVLWPSVTERYMYLCPKEDTQWSDEGGVLVQTDGRWLIGEYGKRDEE